MTWQMNRRGFLQASAAGAACLVAGSRARAIDLNSKLRLAAIGTGGKGQDDLLKNVNDFVQKNTANGELNKLYQKWLGADFPKF